MSTKEREYVTMHCETPMVSTCMFSGSEYYCPSCGTGLGIMNTESVEATPALLKQHKKNRELFDQIAGDCIAAGMWRKDCSKCNVGDGRDFSKGMGTEHRLHASHADLEKSDKAYQKLYGGILS